MPLLSNIVTGIISGTTAAMADRTIDTTRTAINRNTSVRTIASSDRTIATREPVSRGSGTIPANPSGEQWLASLIPPLSGTSIGISAPSRVSAPSSNIQYPVRNVPAIVSGGNTNVNGSSGNGDLSLADIFLRTFGASQGISPIQQPNTSVVPIGESGGGSNLLLILAVLGAAGFGIWYFYFR